MTKQTKFAALARRITDNLCLLQQYKWNTIKIGLPRLIINAPYGSSSMIILDFFSSRRKNWPLFTGYFGSWGHALVAVAVEETFKQESLCRLSLETENSDPLERDGRLWRFDFSLSISKMSVTCNLSYFPLHCRK